MLITILVQMMTSLSFIFLSYPPLSLCLFYPFANFPICSPLQKYYTCDLTGPSAPSTSLACGAKP